MRTYRKTSPPVDVINNPLDLKQNSATNLSNADLVNNTTGILKECS
jgi:hypothetical protein